MMVIITSWLGTVHLSQITVESSVERRVQCVCSKQAVRDPANGIFKRSFSFEIKISNAVMHPVAMPVGNRRDDCVTVREILVKRSDAYACFIGDQIGI